MSKYFLLALSVIFVLAACNKKPTPAAPDRANMFRTGKWKISGGTFTRKLPYGETTDTTFDYLSFIPECHKDDYIIFDSLMYAAVYSGANKCNAGDAEKIPFIWQLKANGNRLDLYNGFNNLYTAGLYIQPYKFDTVFYDGVTLELDTVVGALDTPLKGPIIVLDTVWPGFVIIDTATTPQISIYDAEITDFTQSSFKLHFSVISTYPDVRDGHWSSPVMRPDTMKYHVTYTNF